MGFLLFQVQASAPCVLSGYMQLKTSKSWVSRWFALHSDFVLYSFRSHTDRQAMTATPVPGFTVSLVRTPLASSALFSLLLVIFLFFKLIFEFYAQLLDNKGEPEPGKEKTFKMFHKRKTYYFQTNTREDTERQASIPPCFCKIHFLLSVPFNLTYAIFSRWVRDLKLASHAELPSPDSSSTARWRCKHSCGLVSIAVLFIFLSKLFDRPWCFPFFFNLGII